MICMLLTNEDPEDGNRIPPGPSHATMMMTVYEKPTLANTSSRIITLPILKIFSLSEWTFLMI